MKIYNKVVMTMSDFEIIEEDSFDYEGELALCWIGAAIGAVSAITGALGSMKSADAAKNYARDQQRAAEELAKHNAQISLDDAITALKQADNIVRGTQIEIGTKVAELDRILAGQRVVYSARGVVTTTGSPLDVQLKTVYEGQKDIERIKYNGKLSEEEAIDLANRYVKLSKYGLRDAAVQASLTASAWNQKAENMQWQGLSNAFSQAYTVGANAGWWGD